MRTTDQNHQVVHPLQGAGLMHGNVLERHAIEHGVQRLNVTNTNGVRPLVLNIRQPYRLGRSVGGNHRGESVMTMRTTAAKQGR